jgi:NhaA family Na+:H+ antiporter
VPLLLWVNDGLMAIFFLLVALEIKRETLSGQLAGRERLILPLICATAGVAVPALLFVALNHGNAAAMRGWAVPTATDIAFALGVLALLGSRVPVGMKLLLSTIAVVDDLIAILIIAIFYSHGMSFGALGLAAPVLATMWLLGRSACSPCGRTCCSARCCGVRAEIRRACHARRRRHGADDPACRQEERDSRRDRTFAAGNLEHALHPWVAYAILPVFAFANAGLMLGGLQMQDALAALPLGIALGLVVGKPVGIVSAAILMRALGWARFPEGMDLRAMLGLGCCAGSASP